MSWELTGNAGTSPARNFLGTTDNQPLVIKTNGTAQLLLDTGTTSILGISATVNVETSDILKLERPPVGGIKNANSAGFFVGAFEPGISGRSQLDINVAGTPGPNNSFGGIPDVTVMSLRGDGNVRIDGNLGVGGGLGVEGPLATTNVQASEILRLTRPSVSAVKNANSAGFLVGAFEPGINGRSRLDINVAGTPGDSNGWGGRPDVTVISLLGNGSVGIGTTSPMGDSSVSNSPFKLAVAGAETTEDGGQAGIQLSNSASGGANWYLRAGATNTATPAGGFSIANDDKYCLTIERNGNVTIDGDVILTGADCAEEFDVAEAVEIEPGTLMVLDQEGRLQQSHQAYDKRAAGVISGAGDYKPGLILDRQQSHDGRVPVALVGKVYCKVDAQYAPIEVGDLLTSSPTPGHAMKADDPLKAFGAVIGKALSPLDQGCKPIPILVALQ